MLRVVYAHCDIPCGIYDPTPAKIAAKTVERMVTQIKDLSSAETSGPAYLNDISRRVRVKEQHAETCKQELFTLWADFFKPEHVEKYSNLHDLFWKATKLCSKNKQTIDEAAARELTAAVDEIAKIFYEVKSDPVRYNAYKEVTDKLF